MKSILFLLGIVIFASTCFADPLANPSTGSIIDGHMFPADNFVVGGGEADWVVSKTPTEARVILEVPDLGAWGSSTEITISIAGVAVLPAPGYYTIDTNADAATDDLVQITGLEVGDEIIIAPDNDARTVVLKNGINLVLCRGADFILNNTKDRIKLQAIGSDVLVEISRSSGGD